MNIEHKKLSPTETLLYIIPPLHLTGAFYATPDTSEAKIPLLQNLIGTNLAQTLLLTADFLYIKSKDASMLDDLTSLALAEIDDFFSLSPKTQTAPNGNISDKAAIILKAVISPILKQDGGDIEFVKYENNTAYIRFLGKCNGCPYAKETLKNKVEKNIIRYLPEIREAVMI